MMEKGRHRKTVSKRDCFHLLVHSPNTFNSQGGGNKAVFWEPNPGLIWMAGTQLLKPSLAAS